MAKILIINDSKLVLAHLEKTLADANHKVITAPGGRSGLALLRKKPVHLVITDVHMPEMNGVEVMETLQKKHPTVRTIATSTETDTELVRRAAKMADATFKLKKSFGMAELLLAVEGALSPSQPKQKTGGAPELPLNKTG